MVSNPYISIPSYQPPNRPNKKNQATNQPKNQYSFIDKFKFSAQFPQDEKTNLTPFFNWHTSWQWEGGAEPTDDTWHLWDLLNIWGIKPRTGSAFAYILREQTRIK